MADLRAQVDMAHIAETRQQSTGRLLSRAARAFSIHATELLRARGHEHLSLVHTTLLAFLDLEGTRISTLADRAGITKQSAGQLVAELEERGYVARNEDPADRRATLVTFTEAGWQFLVDAGAIKREIEAEYAALLSAKGLEDLRAALNRLITHAETPSGEHAAPEER